MSEVLVLDGCHVVTMDDAGTEYPVGHVVIEGSRIVRVGSGLYDPAAPPPSSVAGMAGEGGDYGGSARVVDATGCVVTPGLVNTHHHLYQWATRGLAVDATLFEWLTALYPVWGRLDADIVGAAAAAGLGRLALTGCNDVDGSPLRLPPRGR